MRESFAEFLEKNKKKVIWDDAIYEDAISLNALGKWHFSKWIELMRRLKYSNSELSKVFYTIITAKSFPLNNFLDELEALPFQSHLEIAVDCLGQENIEKRLRELK